MPIDFDSYKKDLLRQRAEIEERIAVLNSIISEAEPYLVPDPRERLKSLGDLWASLAADCGLVALLKFCAHPDGDFAVPSDENLKPHCVEASQVSGLMSLLSKRCKNAGLAFGEVIQRRRRWIDGSCRTIYRFRSEEVRSSFLRHFPPHMRVWPWAISESR